MSSLSTDLHLAAQQKLALTPQLKEALQVLQMSTQDLAEAVAEKYAKLFSELAREAVYCP